MKYDKAISEALKILEEAQKPNLGKQQIILLTRVGEHEWSNDGDVLTDEEVEQGLEEATHNMVIMMADFGCPGKTWPDSDLIPSQPKPQTDPEFLRKKHQEAPNYTEGMAIKGGENPVEEFDPDWMHKR